MAFINGREVFFSPQVNGVLSADVQHKIETSDMFYKWLNAGIETEDTYDFVNVFGVDLYNSNFKFSNFERTIFDSYTTKVTRELYIYDNPYLLSVTMPNVSDVQARGFYHGTAMTYCEVGKIESTTTTSFQGCTALETFKCKEGTTGDIYLQYSPNLTVDSLEGIIDSYADMTGQTAPILSIGETNIAKLSEEYIAKAKQKNIMLK